MMDFAAGVFVGFCAALATGAYLTHQDQKREAARKRSHPVLTLDPNGMLVPAHRVTGETDEEIADILARGYW
jgi:hypothetical protein